MRKETPKSLRKKCDDLLTPLIKKMSPACLLCGRKTEVAHHHVHKSKSTVLRYTIENLIPLCNHCHLALHWNESYWASKIVQLKGIAWFNKLEREKNKIVKADIIFYQTNYGRLKKLYEQL